MRLAVFARHGSGQLELLDYDAASFDLQADMARDAVVATTLRLLLEGKGLGSRKTAIALDGQSVFSRLVKLPPVAADKLEQTIRHEAVQNIPFPIDEVVWDSCLNSEAAEPEVLLVAVKDELVSGVVSAVGANGLSVDAVAVAPSALVSAVRYNYSDLEKPTLLVDMGQHSTNLVFIDGERLFFRALPVAGSMMPRLLQDIDRSISFYRSQQGGNAPAQVLLTGNLAGLDHPEVLIADRLALPVERFDPLQKVVSNSDVDADIRSQLGVLVGLAAAGITGGSVPINLIPAALQKEQSLRRRQPLWVACAVVAVFIAAVWLLGTTRLAALARQESHAVGVQIEVLEKVEKQLIPLEQRIASLENRAGVYSAAVPKRTFWLEALSEVRERMFEGMFLLKSEPLRKDDQVVGMRIEVVSYLDKEPEEQDAVKLLRDNLRKSARFSNRTRVFKRPTKRLFFRRFVVDVFFEEPMS
jgi:Tfp pilus assembly PilM family ATPase